MAVKSSKRTPTQSSVEPHSVESGVRRELLSSPNFSVTSLVVRRIPNGVCLEGMVEVHGKEADIDATARRVLGVQEVQNHLLVCSQL